MKKLVLAICGALVLGSAEAQAASDDGVLIVGIGYTKSGMRSYEVHYKLAGARESWPFPDPYVGFIPGGVWANDPDFQSHETGRVVVKRLKPGNYEFYTVGIDGPPANVLGSVRLESRQNFSVPFTIKPGEATYVGDFTFVFPVAAETALPAHADAANSYIVLSDQHERDIPIAQKKMPNLGPVTVAVPDASTLGSPLIRAKEGP